MAWICQLGSFPTRLPALSGGSVLLIGGSSFLRLHVDECLRDEVGGDGLVDLCRERADHDRLDIDDAREVAEAIEEDREVVIAPVDGHGDRPLRIGITSLCIRETREGQAPENEVALVDERLDLLDDLFRVARRGKNAAQLLELELQPLHFLTELRELALRGAA